MLFLNPVQCKTGISFNQQYDNGNKDIRLYILCIDYSKYITSKVKKSGIVRFYGSRNSY